MSAEHTPMHSALVHRSERAKAAKGELLNDFFGGWKDSDFALLRPYAYDPSRIINPHQEIIDWMGVRTDLSFHAWLTIPDNGLIILPDLPMPDDQIHAEAIEYISTVVAIERARRPGNTTFTVIELGASYGPWATASAVVALRHGFTQVNMIAVEASAEAVPNIFRHAQHNGLTNNPAVSLNAIHGAVHVRDEDVFFPRISTSHDNGAQLSTEASSVDYRGLEVEYDRVSGYSLRKIIGDHPIVEFVHLDLQGAEEALLGDEDFLHCLTSRVVTFYMATQSRYIEGLALKVLPKLGWRLVRERPTTFEQNDRTQDVNGWTLRDGGQLWLNANLSDIHLNL